MKTRITYSTLAAIVVCTLFQANQAWAQWSNIKIDSQEEISLNSAIQISQFFEKETVCRESLMASIAPLLGLSGYAVTEITGTQFHKSRSSSVGGFGGGASETWTETSLNLNFEAIHDAADSRIVPLVCQGKPERKVW